MLFPFLVHEESSFTPSLLNVSNQLFKVLTFVVSMFKQAVKDLASTISNFPNQNIGMVRDLVLYSY